MLGVSLRTVSEIHHSQRHFPTASANPLPSLDNPLAVRDAVVRYSPHFTVKCLLHTTCRTLNRFGFPISRFFTPFNLFAPAKGRSWEEFVGIA
jgi:hypothetical protein